MAVRFHNHSAAGFSVFMRSLWRKSADSPRAWLVVGAAFLASFVVFGVTYSFGVFLQPMAAELHASRTETSALFAITSLVNYTLASVTGRLSDRCGPRVVIGAGALLMGLGLVLTAFIHNMRVGYLTYGVGVGLGAACAYVPTLALIGGWFARRRNTALGIAAAGTGCGTLATPPLAAALISRYGWRTTDLLLGIAAAFLLGVCALAADRPILTPMAAVKRSIRRMVFSIEFILLYASWLLATTALFVPFVLLAAYARDRGNSAVDSAFLLSCIGGVSIIGRLGVGVLGDRFAVVRLFKATVLVMALSYVIWLVAPSYLVLIVFAVVLGLSYGARISLMPGVLIEFFGLEDLGGTLGVFFTSSGVSAVLGPLLAAYIVDLAGGYRWGIAFALAMGALGFAAIAPLRGNHRPIAQAAAQATGSGS